MANPDFGFERKGGREGVEWVRWNPDIQVIKFNPPGTFAVQFKEEQADGEENQVHFGPWFVAWGNDRMIKARPEQQADYTENLIQAKKISNSG